MAAVAFTAERSTITFAAGNATIELRRQPLGHFSITTLVGPKRAEEWCATYATEQAARDEARRTALLFAFHGTDTAIAQRTAELAARRAFLASHDRWSTADRRDDADAARELEVLETLTGRLANVRLAEDIAEFLAG